MSRPQDAERNQEATCYVGNIDERATDALIWELMIQAGPIVNVHLPKDRITATHQGYGFAEFQTEADAEYACRIMNGIKLFGKPIRVNKASSDRKQIDIGANLFVGNLDGAVDERMLYETFSAFGSIVGVPKVARDEQTGVSRNFGFVSFDSFEASDAAIESLHNQFLLNRPVNVTYALKKDGKGGERHGTPAERLLAAQARKNNALPQLPRFVPPPPPVVPGQAGAAGMGSSSASSSIPTQASSSGMPSQPPPPPAGMYTAGPPPAPPAGFSNGMSSAGAPAAPPPPPPGIPIATASDAFGYPPSQQAYQHNPYSHHPGAPPQHYAPAYGAPPPPPLGPNGQPMYYGPPPGMYNGPPPPQQFMTGANNAPLGPRQG